MNHKGLFEATSILINENQLVMRHFGVELYIKILIMLLLTLAS